MPSLAEIIAQKKAQAQETANVQPIRPNTIDSNTVDSSPSNVANIGDASNGKKPNPFAKPSNQVSSSPIPTIDTTKPASAIDVSSLAKDIQSEISNTAASQEDTFSLAQVQADNADDFSMTDIDTIIFQDAAITLEDIVPRIRRLESLSEMDAEKEMKLLKNALMANPSAVSLMLPTDVGMLVATLRRVTGLAKLNADKKKADKVAKSPTASFKAAIKNVTTVEDF